MECRSNLLKVVSEARLNGNARYPDRVETSADVRVASRAARVRDLERLASDLNPDSSSRKEFRAALRKDECRKYAFISIENPAFYYSHPVVIREERDSIDRANRQADEAQDALLEEYRRKAVRHRLQSSASGRVDMFEFADGSITVCTTTVRNNARATSCR
jgi:hypothetical protein